ncbi:MAG: T9SS C-terminal target domain-containing protein [Bacteroidetes bacterium]|nr:MAG: T9SS C-terminal target domain-containing protein [Bacteroidota bacterium]
MRNFAFFLLACLAWGLLPAQSARWVPLGQTPLPAPPTWGHMPDRYQVYDLDVASLQSYLGQAPAPYQSASALEVEIPLPDGQLARFALIRSLTIPDALAARYPHIRSYQGLGIDNPQQRLRLQISPKGVHVMVRQPGRTAYIEPYGQGTHIAYWQDELGALSSPDFICETEADLVPQLPRTEATTRNTNGEILLYRMAISSDELYTAFHGGQTGALAAIVVVLDRVNEIYEREAGIQFQLVPNNDLLMFTSGNDPFTQGNNATMRAENQQVVDNLIGDANYDIGHVFTQITQGSVGQASLACVCQSGNKARAVSGFASPVGDDFILTAVAHEMGHQFAATHTFNTDAPNCGANRTGSTAYEPGSGSTLMSYAGACNPHNVAPDAEDYYHGFSLQQILTYTRQGPGSNCPQVIQTGNTDPSVSAGDGGFFIPHSTPFELEGFGFDPDGDSITYCWEQMDLGPAGHPNFPVGNAPLFRSFQPRPTPSRTFPRIQNVVANSQQIGEILPAGARDLNFRLTVRDLLGGIDQDDISFQVAGQAGPFLVSYPNDPGITWTGGTYEQVSWDVAGTDLSPVNCQTVNLRLSTDGGFTYPITLAQGIPNNGSAWVLVPELNGTMHRLRVEAADNVFFDISNANFAIVPASNPGFSLVAPEPALSLCAGSETGFSLFTGAQLGFSDTLTLLTPGLQTGLTAIFSPAQVVPGDTVTCMLQGDSTLAPGSYPLVVVALASTGGSELVNLTLEVTAPTAVPTAQALGPVDLAGQSATMPVFSWAPLPTATRYALEVATSPAFGASIMFQVDGLSETTSSLPFALTPATTYYWRVRGGNACGDGPFGPTQAFHTGSCQQVFSSQVPVAIPAFGNPASASTPIIVNGSGTLSSLQLIDLQGVHPVVNQLEMSLSSPSGTEVLLFSQPCSTFDANFDLNFADGGLTMLNCPPTDGAVYAPSESFGAFAGEPLGGTWTLHIRDLVNFDGGTLENWGLELCSETTVAPELVINQALQTQSWYLDTLTNSRLAAVDASSGAADITYTLIDLPAEGSLRLDGTDLSLGETFSQADLDQGRITYLHHGGSASSDAFRFDLRNPAGGWSGIFTYDIEIIQTTALSDPLRAGYRFYPNPAQAWVSVEALPGAASVQALTLHTLTGQRMMRQAFAGGTTSARLKLEQLPAGLYLLEVETEAGRIWHRLYHP